MSITGVDGGAPYWDHEFDEQYDHDKGSLADPQWIYYRITDDDRRRVAWNWGSDEQCAALDARLQVAK